MTTVRDDAAEAPPSLFGDYLVNTVLIAIWMGLAVWFVLPDSLPARLLPFLAARVVLALLFTLMVGMFVSRRNIALADWAHNDLHLTSTEEYRAHGVGPLPNKVSTQELYLDLMKRAVMNLLYEDRPSAAFDERGEPVIADRFRLEWRVMGEDQPRQAHTMVGVHRLTNLQYCVEQILRENIPGDLLEAGVMRGGASIFLRAVLKAHECTDRKVIACDTFLPSPTTKPTLSQDLIMGFIASLAAIPREKLHRRLFHILQRVKPEERNFPVTENPSPGLVKLVMFMARHARQILVMDKDRTSVAAVQSHFAAYGLLDEQVMFLKGFFSDTLPTAPLEKLALIRLDGDLYESTMDVLNPLYPKLSPGGFCIIDDYNSIPDCKRAVTEYRAAHKITAELHPIDRAAVYWRKPFE